MFLSLALSSVSRCLPCTPCTSSCISSRNLAALRLRLLNESRRIGLCWSVLRWQSSGGQSGERSVSVGVRVRCGVSVLAVLMFWGKDIIIFIVALAITRLGLHWRSCFVFGSFIHLAHHLHIPPRPSCMVSSYSSYSSNSSNPRSAGRRWRRSSESIGGSRQVGFSADGVAGR